jgi:dipeptidyl aminopeptidase/acylaminoacyl peptidase
MRWNTNVLEIGAEAAGMALTEAAQAAQAASAASTGASLGVAAAWAGAPVVNMTSAYGGIRWGAGINRQFQYEKTQSRIGANLWERPDLYIKNSPLFELNKVKTPIVIMSNDADDAVPWYQGIEMFTAMRRLSKPIWMLVYNNEAHNLVERKNRKDIQIREQQFFDHYLKGAPMPIWMSKGVPAIMKGRDLGLGY